MRYYKRNGEYIRTIGTLDLPEITAEEYAAEMQAIEERMQASAEIAEASRPLTLDEVQRLVIRQQVNSLYIPDATASRMADYFPTLAGDGSLVKAETRINWNGSLKKASVDLWDTDANSPDAAPTLWTDIAYKDGIRIIPETISAADAFAKEELGWWDGHIYKSGMDGNVWVPGTTGVPWDLVR